MRRVGGPTASRSGVRLAVLTVGLLSASSMARAADRPPNIIIVLADDLGYADLGCYGARNLRTPHLDRLAREGRRLTNFHVAQPICSASRAALLTGCYPNRLGIHGALSPRATIGLAAGEWTLAEILRARGYATGMAGKWHLGHAPPFLPRQHGFDEYLGLPYSNDMAPGHPTARPGTYPPLPLIAGDQIVEADLTLADQRRLTARYTALAVDFITRHRDRPFFFYLAQTRPHVPLAADAGFAGRTGQGAYSDVVAEIDDSLGQILATLQAHDLERDTLVVFTSDNGPWLSYGDHAGSAGPLREGKATCWEGGLRVPCILRWPGQVPAGTTSDACLMTIDLVPTLARITGATLPTHPLDGRDVWPLLTGVPGATNPHDAYLYYFNQNELHAVVTGDGRWKLQLPHQYASVALQPRSLGTMPARPEPRLIARPELYDLVVDLGETHDVAAAEPAIVAQLQEVAERARTDLGDALTHRPGRGQRPPGRVAGANP